MGNFILTAQHGHAAGTSADRSEDIASAAQDALGALQNHSLRELASTARARAQRLVEAVADILLTSDVPTSEEIEAMSRQAEQECWQRSATESDLAMMERIGEQRAAKARERENLEVLANQAREARKVPRTPRVRKDVPPQWAVKWRRIHLPIERIVVGLEELGATAQLVDENGRFEFSAQMVIDAMRKWDPDSVPGMSDQVLVTRLKQLYPGAKFNARRPKRLDERQELLSDAYERGERLVESAGAALDHVSASLRPMLVAAA